MTDLPNALTWQLRWPGPLVGEMDVIEGTLIYPIDPFPGKEQWDETDVRAARLVYPDQPVVLTADGSLILVGPGAEVMAAALKSADPQ